jgi:hypothetical protein
MNQAIAQTVTEARCSLLLHAVQRQDVHGTQDVHRGKGGLPMSDEATQYPTLSALKEPPNIAYLLRVYAVILVTR